MTETAIIKKIIKQANSLLEKKFYTLGTKSIHFKNNEEIVTATDILINNFITKQLLKNFPDDDIISEESQKIDKPGKNIWYIDPLDGTTNFSYGIREIAVCLAKLSPTKTEFGFVGLPLAKEIYWAKYGKSAYLNNKKIHVSSSLTHGKKIMLFLCGGHKKNSQQKFLNIIKKLNPDKIRFRVLSSAGIELTSVACGRADGCILTDIQPWDTLAGVLIIRPAGGKVTNFKGEEWTIKDNTLVASNGKIHNQLLQLL